MAAAERQAMVARIQSPLVIAMQVPKPIDAAQPQERRTVAVMGGALPSLRARFPSVTTVRRQTARRSSVTNHKMNHLVGCRATAMPATTMLLITPPRKIGIDV
jgi:hypothetical protein